MGIQGKTAIVTGAGSGIGKATALRMAGEGANVIIIDIDKERAERAATEISEIGGTVVAFTGDICDSLRIRQIVADVAAQFGNVDVLVNNAGGPAEWIFKWEAHKRFIDTAEEDWKKVLEINLSGTMIVTQAVLPGMIEKRKGKIVNVASVAGVNGLARLVDYSAAKGGVISLTRALAIELSEYKINVNCISPGSVHTQRGFGPPSFLGRSGEPAEFASLIYFLASDESDFITGQNYIIDGGRVLSTKCD
jgi:NAD(P)-dependent dehydrogenase (short-subunit alcohol dehydrogenase family)